MVANEHQPSKSQEAAPCAETIEKPFLLTRGGECSCC
jgi:hypothetical protein